MKQFFGGIISIIVLIIYVILIGYALWLVFSVPGDDPTTDFTAVMSQALAVIGGLISALIISVLAVNKKGEAIGKHLFRAVTDENLKIKLESLVKIYISIWIVIGLIAFFVSLFHPEQVPSLTTLGQAWLGLAVSASYAYFGLEPS